MAKRKSQQWANRIVSVGEVDPTTLLANPANWRIHPDNQREALRGSLDRVGWVERVMVNQRTGFVIDGHLRVAMAIARKQQSIPVSYVDLTPDEEAFVLATLDPIAALAETDSEMLRALAEAVDFDNAALEDMLAGLIGEDVFADGEEEDVGDDPGADLDRAEMLQQKWQVQRGQIWQIGRQRLMCGDSTSRQDVEALLAGERAACMWTDPPYGVNYVGKTADALTIQNDGAGDLPGLLRASFACASRALMEGAAVYVAHPAGALSLEFIRAFIDAGWRLHQTLVWVKDTIVLGHSDYHYRHEPILFGYTAGGGRRGRGAEGWYGDNAQSSVLEFDRPTRNAEHPTMKPPELVVYCLENSSRNGEAVYEPFAGSGSTLVACAQTGRRGFGVEIDPKYCAVILERLTGMGLEAHLTDAELNHGELKFGTEEGSGFAG